MSEESRLSQPDLSDLQAKVKQLTEMQKEHLWLLFEIAATKAQVEEERLLAQIEAKVYSGIKRFLKPGKS